MAITMPLQTATCPQHHPYDVSLGSDTRYENPFHVDVRARLTGPDGQTTVIHGFFDELDSAGGAEGENTWKVRLCPNQIGTWRYFTQSSDPALAGQEGTIECTANPNSQVHGALLVDHLCTE
jgi:hypothetical protein